MNFTELNIAWKYLLFHYIKTSKTMWNIHLFQGVSYNHLYYLCQEHVYSKKYLKFITIILALWLTFTALFRFRYLLIIHLERILPSFSCWKQSCRLYISLLSNKVYHEIQHKLYHNAANIQPHVNM